MRKTPKKISRRSAKAAELRTYYVAPCCKGHMLMAHTSDRSRANAKCASTPCAAVGEVLARSRALVTLTNFSANQQNETSTTRTPIEDTAMSKKVSNLEAAQTGRQFC
jgi:hypothetical protein